MASRPTIAGIPVARFLRALADLVKTKAVGARAVFGGAGDERGEEPMPAAFQPDVMLPVQYFEALRRRPFLEGEKLLFFTILKQAIDDYMGYVNAVRRRGQRKFREAEEWIDREDRTSLFSFENVCAALDIDPDYMRQGLHRWKLAHQQETESLAEAH